MALIYQNNLPISVTNISKKFVDVWAPLSWLIKRKIIKKWHFLSNLERLYGSCGCFREDIALLFHNVLLIGVTNISEKFFDIWASPSWPKIRKNQEKIKILAKIAICLIVFHYFGYSKGIKKT